MRWPGRRKPLAHLPTDVQSGQVAYGERPHRHAEVVKGAIDLLWHRTLLEQESGLAHIRRQHPVADKAFTDPDDCYDLSDPPGELDRSRDDLRRGFRTPNDLQQAHDVRGAEEMQADHILRAGGAGCDGIDVQSRR